jgi:hypothetical protein
VLQDIKECKPPLHDKTVVLGEKTKLRHPKTQFFFFCAAEDM